MTLSLYLLPLISALIGWGTNVLAVKLLFRPRQPRGIGPCKLQGVIPHRQSELASKLADVVVKELLPPEELSSKLEAIDIETEVQQLLNRRIDVVLERFKEKTPMVSLVLNEGVTTKIKRLVIEEVVDELPVWKKSLAEKVVHHLNLYGWVEEKVLSFDVDRVERIVLGVARHELRMIEWLGGVLGFLIGLLQLALVWCT